MFPTERIVVFCDGDFWHGNAWRARRRKLAKGANADYWVAKIRANMVRDRKHTAALKSRGWKVLRYWESEIAANPERIARQVARTVYLARRRVRS